MSDAKTISQALLILADEFKSHDVPSARYVLRKSAAKMDYLVQVNEEMYAMLDDLANGRGTAMPIEKLLAKARGEITSTSEQNTNKQQLNDKSPGLVK